MLTKIMNKIAAFLSSVLASLTAQAIAISYSAASAVAGGVAAGGVIVYFLPPPQPVQILRSPSLSTAPDLSLGTTISIGDMQRIVTEVTQTTISTENIQEAARVVAQEIVHDAGTCVVALYVEFREHEREGRTAQIPSECSEFTSQASAR